MIPQLLQPPSTKWVSLQPHDSRILVALPNISKSVGYVPQTIASILVKFLEAPSKYGPAGGCPQALSPDTPIKIFVEGVLHVEMTSRVTTFRLALLLFSHGKHIIDICTQMMEAFIPLRRPPRYTPTRHNNINLANLSLNNFIQLSDYSSLPYDHTLLEVLSGCDLEPCHPPTSVIQTKLLSHQAQGLAFLLNRESSNSISANALWKKSCTEDGHYLWEMKTSGTTVAMRNPEERPPTPLGSILANDMGLGKTLQSLSLVASTQIQAAQHGLPSESGSSSLPPHQATLIICPSRVLDNWAQEIKKHTYEGTIPYVKYHGGRQKEIPVNTIKNAMIVLTTYGVVTLDYAASLGNQVSFFYSRNWYRTILDEAQ